MVEISKFLPSIIINYQPHQHYSDLSIGFFTLIIDFYHFSFPFSITDLKRYHFPLTMSFSKVSLF